MKFLTAILNSSLLFCLATGCTRQSSYVNDNGVIWNTTYSITYDSPELLTDDILATLTEVELSVSSFNDRSLVSALNRGEQVKADRHLRAMVDESQKINHISHGAFDPTLGPLIEMWGFGRNRNPDEVTDEQIAQALTSVGINDCTIDDDGTVRLKSADTQLNFSAIAKGYGVDCVAQTLRDNGCKNYMIEIGGEIVLAGKSPRGTLWNIQIDAPETDNDDHAALTYITLTDCAIATSGNYRNYQDRDDGIRYGHTISPVTGRPVTTNTLSATVIAPTCTLADALATSCMAMDSDEALAMIASIPDAACLLVLAPACDRSPYRILTSPNWPN